MISSLNWPYKREMEITKSFCQPDPTTAIKLQIILADYQKNACKNCGRTIDDQFILESKRYLLGTSNQVNQIAYFLGYEDVSRTVANTVAMGTTAGMMVNKELILEAF